ncbi:MAG: aminotransferase class V-fold PLP-dependent enzyme [Bryobacteraceae bacterium]
MRELLFKEAQSSSEFQQIHALNHRVFGEEIAQHQTHPSGLLVDRFHSENHYFIAVREGVVIGMISAHPGPEFSVTKRLPDASVVSAFARPVEVRLLAIDSQERNRTVVAGLLWQIYDFARSNGFSHLLISAITERESMYRKIGFRPLGPAVPDGSASFIPMVMPIADERITQSRRIHLHERHWNRAAKGSNPISLMPGPVSIHPRVSEAFASSPVSHRSPAFIECYEEVKSLLKGLLSGTEVALFTGSGTLANDAVAANLKAIFGDAKGLVLTNGEFGERIANQALRAGLTFHQLDFAWGEPWSFHAIRDAVDHKPTWVWGVQLETSTGVLNDTETLLKLANDAKCAVALDCVSSVGATRLVSELRSLFFATGVSGKSIGAYAGLAFVYLSEECRYLLSNKTLCPSFDLVRMHQTRGPLSTVLSSSLLALARALEENYGSQEAAARRFEEYFLLGEQTRRLMRSVGLQPLASDAIAAPDITTFVLPNASFPKECLGAGYQIAHESPYLQSQGWGQIATMGNITVPLLEPLFHALRHRGQPANPAYSVASAST